MTGSADADPAALNAGTRSVPARMLTALLAIALLLALGGLPRVAAEHIRLNAPLTELAGLPAQGGLVRAKTTTDAGAPPQPASGMIVPPAAIPAVSGPSAVPLAPAEPATALAQRTYDPQGPPSALQ